MSVQIIPIPDEWKTAEIKFVRSIARSDEPFGGTDRHMIAGGALLEDGSNLYWVDWPTGTRLLRTAPATDYALEERYVGEQPTDADELKAVNQIWRWLLSIVIGATHKAEAELGGRPQREQSA